MSTAEMTVFGIWGLFLTFAVGWLVYARHAGDLSIGDALQGLRDALQGVRENVGAVASGVKRNATDIGLLQRAIGLDPIGVKLTKVKPGPPMLSPDFPPPAGDAPPPSRSPAAVAAQVAEVRGETTGAPVDMTDDRSAEQGPISPGRATVVDAPAAAPLFAGKPRIKVRIETGVFKSERSVSFTANDRTFALFAHESTVDAAEGTMLVTVVDDDGARVLVDLPGEAIQGGRRVQLPREMVLDYPPPSPPGAPPSPDGGPRPSDEEGEQTQALDRDEAARALRGALKTAEPERPTSKRSPPVFRPRRDGSVVVHLLHEDGSPVYEPGPKVPRPDSTRGPMTRPPSRPPSPPFDRRVARQADILIQAAMARGEDVSHCLDMGACRGFAGCTCNCAGCGRRAEIEAEAYRQIHRPPLP